MKPVKIYPRQAEKAYDYRRDFMASMAMVLVLMIMVFRVHFNPTVEVEYTEREQPRIELEDIIQTERPKTPPPPPRPRAPSAVPNEVIIEEDVFDFDIDRPEPTVPPPPPTQAPGEPKEEGEEEDEELEYFIAVEEMPSIIGGMDALYEVLEYPDLARRAGVEGRVIVQFIIDEEGNVRNPQVIRGVGAGLDEAAVEAIKQLRFNPGRQRGRPVAVQYTIPVTFIIDRD